MNNAYFEGEIDDIRIYNRPLTTDEISDLYGENGWTDNNNAPVIHAGQSFDLSEDAANAFSLGNVLATDEDYVDEIAEALKKAEYFDDTQKVFAYVAKTGNSYEISIAFLDPDFDLGPVLTLLLQGNAITSLTTEHKG